MSIEPRRDDTFAIMGPAAELAGKIASTEFVPAGLRNKPAAIMAAILSGRELGMGPMQSLQDIAVIEGKPTLSAKAARALVQSYGHDIWVEEITNTRCTMHGRRRGSENVQTITWTLDDARKAGLANKQNWQRYPRQMLAARCTAELCRLAFADVLGGLGHFTEEMQDEGGHEDVPQSTEGGTTGQPRTQRRRARQKATESTTELPEAPLDLEAAQQSYQDQGPQQWTTPAPDTPPEETQETAGNVTDGRSMTLAQQIAMVCKDAGIERANLIEALTGKTRASDVNRDEAQQILDVARQIARGEARLMQGDGGWSVFPVVDVDQPPEALEFGGNV